MLWECLMDLTLGVPLVVAEKFRQEVPIPWSDEIRIIHSDADLMDVLAEFEEKNVNQIHFIVDYLSIQTVYPNELIPQQPNPSQQPNEHHPNPYVQPNPPQQANVQHPNPHMQTNPPQQANV